MKKKASYLLCCAQPNIFLEQFSWFILLFLRKGIKQAIFAYHRGLHFIRLEEISILLDLTLHIFFLRTRKLQHAVSHHIFVAVWSWQRKGIFEIYKRAAPFDRTENFCVSRNKLIQFFLLEKGIKTQKTGLSSLNENLVFGFDQVWIFFR